MGELKDIIDWVASGAMTAEAAAPRVRDLCRSASGSLPSSDETFARMAGALDERDDRDTFAEVTAAWMAGRIADEQYHVLHEAVTGVPYGRAR